MRVWMMAAAALLGAAPARAEVVSAAAHGFDLRYAVDVSGAPAATMASFAQVARWWGGDHTYSGQAANLSLSAVPGGCFCERLPNGGGIEHLRVTYVDPGKRLVLTGSLGPLLYEATAAVMDVRAEPRAGGTRLTIRYKAAGFAAAGADRLAPLVDKVLAEQMERFRAFAASSQP